MLRIFRQMFCRNRGPFRFESQGHCGCIVYEDAGRTLKIDWELGGEPTMDFVMSLDLRRWMAPEQAPIPLDEQLEILAKLREWLDWYGYRTNVGLPRDTAQEDRPCIWKGCNERRYRGLTICPRHYDLSLLRTD